jgi:hypothetical protein
MPDDPTAKQPSRDHQEGFCKGFMYAMQMIERNRDHYRKLLGQPEMTHADVLKWIYSRPWRDSGTHRTAPRRMDQPPGEPEVGPPAIESIDLYLMPGISGCSVGEDGQIHFEHS